MRQIISAINYLHKKGILHRDIKLDNILLNYENEEDRKNNNIQKAQVKIIDFGFARHLEPAQLAYSTLGSPINMDPGILRKLNKMENSRNYGYDQKADIWSLGTICYEMLIGKCTFDAESMKELVSKVERGNYFLPTYLSKEAVSFLNGMLQYDLKKRLSADQLENHKFLTKPYNELTKINLKEAQKNIIGSQLKINSKINQSIWVIFETDENEEDLNSISPNMYEQNSKKNYSIDSKIDDTSNKKKQNEIIEINNKQIDEKELIKKFLDAFDEMNDDFIYVEPKLIPIIPGDDPSVINKVSEFSEDNF
jgi:serine/threonine protein kinase